MRVERLEQIAALVVTAGLVAGNLLLFTPWRRDRDDPAPNSTPSPSRSTRIDGPLRAQP